MDNETDKKNFLTGNTSSSCSSSSLSPISPKDLSKSIGSSNVQDIIDKHNSSKSALNEIPDASEINIISSQSKDISIQYRKFDMIESEKCTALSLIQDAITQYDVEKEIAAFIKKGMDDKVGPPWHCIVGRDFGSFISHGKITQ